MTSITKSPPIHIAAPPAWRSATKLGPQFRRPAYAGKQFVVRLGQHHTSERVDRHREHEQEQRVVNERRHRIGSRPMSGRKYR